MTAAVKSRHGMRYVRPAPAPEPRMTVIRFNPDAATDTPDWRFVLGGGIADVRTAALREGAEVPPLPRTLDPLLGNRIIPFMQAKNAVRTHLERTELANREPGLMWATTTFESDPTVRYRLEALLLGGATTEEAAIALPTDRNYVWWYERLFFDISAHIGDPRWLFDKVFYRALKAGTTDARYNIVWKLIAGVYGWRTFIDGNDDMIQPLTPDVTERITGMVRSRAAEDAAVAQLTRVINRYNGLAVVEEHHRAEGVEIQRAAAKGEDAASDSAEALAQLVQPILKALNVKRASLDEVPLLEGPMATVFEKRDRENAEKLRVAEARTVTKELSDYA